MPVYDSICSEFGFSKKADLASAKLLASIVGEDGKTRLETIRRRFPKQVLLCGGSKKLADDLSSIVFEGFVIAADGATTTLLESGFGIDMIVTDLDGIIEDQIEQNSVGTPVFLHAHGDNQSSIRRHAEKFDGPLVGTCQCPPPPQLYNFGGFTDGDRAACICAELGTREILLAGFDLDNPAEKAGKNIEIKRKKLAWAKRILDMLRNQGVKIVPILELSK